MHSERTIVHQRSDKFRLGPLRLSVELLCVLIPSTLVCNSDLGEVVVEDGLVEVNNELVNGSIHDPRTKTIRLTAFTASGI